MRHALSAAADKFGERPSFLHATDAGRPIYARMGYETVATPHLLHRQALHGGPLKVRIA
jgi:hypothetical protein